MSEPQEPAATAGSTGEDIKPYQLHVSSKYLDLTSQKLELTRLPREVAEPAAQDWWAPKTTIEPLIDYWQEQYSWREKEDELNASLQQFRTGIHIPSSDPSTSHPPFPFTNLSLAHVVGLFTDPDDAGTTQPFHVVIPSLPGIGFSDALPNNTPLIATTAALFDTLMKRLDYNHYVASNSGPSSRSPSEIDWRLANYLSLNYTESCLGVHFISPSITAPTFRDSPIEWAKWTIAVFLQAAVMDYTKEDLAAVKMNEARSRGTTGAVHTPWHFGPRNDGAYEPNTLAYALCDSPAGLLLFFLFVTRILGPQKEFTPEELITMAELTWLPGPEATFRFLAYCAYHKEEQKRAAMAKPKVGITVFLDENGRTASSSEGSDLPRPIPETYSCPAWAQRHYNVVSSNRVSGQSGLLAWERPEVIVDGVRSLVKEILKSDKRMQEHELPGTALLQVVVDGDQPAEAEISGTTVHVPVRSSSDLPPKDAKDPAAQVDQKTPSPAALTPDAVGGSGQESTPLSVPSQA
ncbi:Alpha/Beta hydrolase protein [Stachybotrys elegans]|uniref:Alpha/Beta hydrolase protein n=1 Tax=Stachybotrys elegans TaxID=80388 RepID=A0A8K0SRI2_9HYPO|nr:Alpha/Beta hydrolase protein [Stachybotrys elegans]